jgi:hypothetical protein
MEITEKLAAIQQELKAPKSQYNSFGKYHYRKCEDILEAVKPLLAKYRCVLTLSDDIHCLGDRYYIKVLATLTDLDADHEITVTALAREEEKKAGMDGSQITGASSSYARKYALNGLFAIDDTADSDTTNVGAETAQNRTQNGKGYSTSVKAQTAAKTKAKHLTSEKYWEAVGKYAEGGTLDDGSDLRDWLAANTDTDMVRFDADVDNYRAAHI